MEHNTIYTLFTINLVLTAEGLQHISEVIAAIFSYMQLIGPNERIFKEIQQIEETSFRFAEEQTASDTVESLCEAMQFFPPKDYLIGSDLFLEYDPKGIDSVINYLKNPENMNIMILCNDLPAGVVYDKTEEWFNTPYAVLDVPETWLNNWKNIPVYPDFILPEPNAFVTTDFTILPPIENNALYPNKILHTDTIELWFRKDQKFNLPVAFYYFHFTSTFTTESALCESMRDMFITFLTIQLIEEGYPALIAELKYTLQPSTKGFVLKINGYNQKLPDLLKLISKHILEVPTKLNKDIFNAIKAKQTKHYYNSFIKPSALAKDLRMSVILKTYWSMVDKHEAIQKVTYDMMKTFCSNFIKKLYIQGLIQGNVDEETALTAANNLVKDLACQPIKKTELPKIQVLKVPKGTHCCKIKSFNSNDSNSIITNYYQSGPFSLKSSMIIELLMMIIEEPLYDMLRTKEQLGYHIYCTIRDTYGIMGYSITVNAQAVKNSTSYVDTRIESFIKYVSKYLKKLPERKLNQFKRDLIKVKQCTDVLLEEEVNRNWMEIVNDDYFFDRLEKEIEILSSIKLLDVKKWWEDHNLCGNKSNLRKITFQIEGYNTQNKENNILSNIEEKKINNVLVEEDKNCINKKDTFENVYQMNLVSDSQIVGCIGSVGEFKNNAELYPHKKPECA